jgi:prepilin-type N-terminal cleavage/methylation domain-containing protein
MPAGAMTPQEPQTMRKERGFSLVELIVAMTVTLIVSSAIYGLLTSGGNAFRREPELADRQQNIRAAMDLIARDVFGAGAAMPTFAQVFTRNDPTGTCNASLNSCGQPGTMGPVAAAARGDDEDTDVLEILSTDEQCSNLSVCSDPSPAGTAATFAIREAVPQCLGVPGLVMLVNSPAPPTNASFAIQAVTATGSAVACPAGAAPPNGNLTLTALLAPPFAVGPFAASDTVFLYRARLVRYRIAPNPDPLDQTPSLWRTESGLFQPNGAAAPEPGGAGFNPAGSPWQLVARGIEDMQLEYRGNGAWLNQPPVSLPNDWTTLVRQVRITLSARANAANLGGESTAGGGAPNAVRGQLSTVVMPRAAFGELQMGNQIQ